MGEPLLVVDHVTVRYPKSAKAALNDVSLVAPQASTLGIVGASGSGKSTLARAVAGLVQPTQGSITIGGVPIAPLSRWRPSLRQCALVQMVFQNPYGSVNPAFTVYETLADALQRHHSGYSKEMVTREVHRYLELVALPSALLHRGVASLSGGQRQRLSIARALSLQPMLLICDEAASALDVSMQGQIINLLKTLQQTIGLTLLFISHDLAAVRYLADSTVVMEDGRIIK